MSAPWIILYAIGWLITAPIIARALAHDFGKPEPDAGSWLYAAAMGSLTALFWPLLAPISLIWIVARTLDTWQLAQQDAAQRRELDRLSRQARIQQLERELGIGCSQFASGGVILTEIPDREALRRTEWTEATR